MEHEGSDLNAFAWQSVRWCHRVTEGGVGSEARATISLRVVALDEERLVNLHFWYIEPAMLGIEGHRVGLADPMLIDEIRGDELLPLHGERIADCERPVAKRSANGTPDVNNLHSSAQQCVCLHRQ